ncbi:MAG: hypothetical protein AAGF99_18300 [Bacteroidota bacterium]
MNRRHARGAQCARSQARGVAHAVLTAALTPLALLAAASTIQPAAFAATPAAAAAAATTAASPAPAAAPIQGSGSRVARLSAFAPPMEFFLLEATLPVPPRTVIEGLPFEPLEVRSETGEIFSTQVEVVSRYPNPTEGADVVELIARVQRPPGKSVGDEIVFEVHRSTQPSADFVASAHVEALFGIGASVRLEASDLHGNVYRANLPEKQRVDHPTVSVVRDGALVRERRSHEMMRPLTGSGTGSTAPAPHMFGVHVFTRTYRNEDFFILDLLLHNGMFGNRPTPSDDPIHDIYFDELTLDVPVGWLIGESVDNPFQGNATNGGGRTRKPIVKELRYGQFHVAHQQAQFVRRIVIARTPSALERGRSVLRRETRGFCVNMGGNGWSWWNPETARFQTTNHVLPKLAHLNRSALVQDIRGRYQSHAAQVRDGAAGGYPRYSAALGWAQPYGTKYGGMTGGDEIEMHPNVVQAWVRHPVALRELEIRSKSYIDRQPIALFDLDGNPPVLEEHVVNAGTSGAYVPTYFYLVPRGSSDYFGLRNADTRFKELAYMTGRVPYYEKDLVDFDPIDLQHYTRFLNAHLGLAWLANDSISKLELELSSACFRMTFHEFYNSAYGNVQGTGLRARIQENAVNPSQGVSFGRGEAWGLIATTAHYALAGRAERAVMFPYMQTVARTARSGQSACTGNTTAVLIHKEFKGAYRTRQSFEVGYFVNAAEAMRSTVFERTDGATNTLLNDLVVDAAYSTVREPFWSTTGNGQVRVIAVRPRDLELAEFCSNIPANGIGDVPYHDQFTGMPAWAYAFARTNDGLFMLRTNQATGSAGNALAQLEALGTDQLDRMAPMLALLQGP